MRSRCWAEATRARNQLIELQHESDRAQVNYQHAIRRLNAAGATLREIADALGLSYQQVHQIVDVSTGKGAPKTSGTDLTRVCGFCGTPQQHARDLTRRPGHLHLQPLRRSCRRGRSRERAPKR